jgi:hypothetical protein
MSGREREQEENPKKKQEGRRAAAGRSVRSTPVVWVGRLGVWAAEEMFFVDLLGLFDLKFGFCFG